MNKIKVLFLALVCLTLISPLSINAQNEEQLTDEITELKTELIMNTQDPATKVVRFILKLTSNIDSDRVKLTWTSSGPNNYTPGQNYQLNGLNASGELRIRKGQTYNIPVDLTIYGQGVNEIIGKVEIVLTEGTKILTVRSNYGSNAEGEVLPLTDAYIQAKNLNNIKNIAIIVVLLAAILIAGYFGLKRFIKWLDSDERKL